MRKKYILNFKFQSRFALSFGLGVLCVLIIVGAAGLSPVFILSGHPMLGPEQQAILLREGKSLAFVLGFLGFLIVLVSVMVGIYFSNRYLGPLRRLEEWLAKNLTVEEFSNFHVRPGDDLQKIVHALNQKAKLKPQNKGAA